jgi:hypothetical protein
MVCVAAAFAAACLLAEAEPAVAAPRQRPAAVPWPLSLLPGVAARRPHKSRPRPARRQAAARAAMPKAAPWPRPRPGPVAVAPAAAPRPAPASPPPRPSTAEAQKPAPAAGPPPQASACRARLADGLAVAAALPPISGPGECGVADPVRMEAIWMRNGRRVTLHPPAVLDCGAAETVAQWVRDEAGPAFPPEGPQLATIAVAASYECRGRNRVAGAKVSEHGFGHALDVSGFKLSDGSVVGLTDPAADRALRERLRGSACARFSTVLGPGSDGYHESHVHLDMIVRPSGYRICQWDIR